MTNDNKPDPKYRDLLVSLDQESQRDYDKAILTLSGGALGISFAFFKDIVGNNPIQFSFLLLISWICWSLSLTSILFSFLSSQRALRKAIQQIDSNQEPRNIANCITVILNIASGILFVLGLISIAIFVFINMRG